MLFPRLRGRGIMDAGRGIRRRRGVGHPFHGRVAVASLKPLYVTDVRRHRCRFPRPYGRGLVEAPCVLPSGVRTGGSSTTRNARSSLGWLAPATYTERWEAQQHAGSS